ncbi:TetR family transcriptional regulator C-terminal domain-containing protein [Microbacterium sp. LS_15]|uniref:TetR/AcrR family transcriptional regulator n=1 Tax=Microbacterium sp. LS_15 TaxID=3055790 RepID=UPI0035C1741C
MPRLIDHREREKQIAAAVWRIVLADGVSAVSLRTVAAEAGLVVGSVRHIFPTKSDLLEFAMRLVHERAAERITPHLDDADAVLSTVEVIDELLPLDDERIVEIRVHLALTAEAPRHAQLAALADAAHDDIARLCRRLLRRLVDAGALTGEIAIDDEARYLQAVIDGVALHGSRGELSPTQQTSVLRTHLRRLGLPV